MHKSERKQFPEMHRFEDRIIREGRTPTLARRCSATHRLRRVYSGSPPFLCLLSIRAQLRLRLRICFVCRNRSSAAHCIGGSVASLLLLRVNAACAAEVRVGAKKEPSPNEKALVCIYFGKTSIGLMVISFMRTSK